MSIDLSDNASFTINWVVSVVVLAVFLTTWVVVEQRTNQMKLEAVQKGADPVAIACVGNPQLSACIVLASKR